MFLTWWTTFLRYFADINYCNLKGCTPVYNATKNGHFEIVKLLAESGADLSKSDNSGRIPLLIAKMNNHELLVQFLVQAVPMSTVRMSTADKIELQGVFKIPKAQKSFTSTRFTRKKDPELSDDSSDDGQVFDDGHSTGITEIKRPKVRNWRAKPKHSRNWILFKELS